MICRGNNTLVSSDDLEESRILKEQIGASATIASLIMKCIQKSFDDGTWRKIKAINNNTQNNCGIN